MNLRKPKLRAPDLIIKLMYSIYSRETMVLERPKKKKKKNSSEIIILKFNFSSIWLLYNLGEFDGYEPRTGCKFLCFCYDFFYKIKFNKFEIILWHMWYVALVKMHILYFICEDVYFIFYLQVNKYVSATIQKPLVGLFWSYLKKNTTSFY